MPKVLLFAACEKGSIDHDTLLPNLYGVFHYFRVNARPTELEGSQSDVDPSLIEEGVVLSIPWCAMCYLSVEPEERNTRYLLKCEVFQPNGALEERLNKDDPTTIYNVTRYCCQYNYSGIIYRGPGVYMLRLSLREDTEGGEWSMAAEYPLTVGLEPWIKPTPL